MPARTLPVWRRRAACARPDSRGDTVPGHAETRVVDYDAGDMFALVANVDAYSEFLPWCAASRVTSRRDTLEGEVVEADLVVAFRVFRETFASRVILRPEEGAIDVEYLDGPFTYLETHWRLRDLGPGRCEIDFRVEFEIKDRLLDRLVGALFQRAMEKVVGAFEARAEALYGEGSRS